MLAIRIDEAMNAQLAQLAQRLPATTKSGLARVLLERALREIDGDVLKLVAPTPAPDAQASEELQ